MRTYRFHGLTPEGAAHLAEELVEEGLRASVLPPGHRLGHGWAVEAEGDGFDESMMEVLAHFFGGTYEGEDLAGA
jgi:hypothetical protein